MSELVNLFRKDQYNSRFRDFKRFPTDSPTCPMAEYYHKRVLNEGVSSGDGLIKDPTFKNYVIAGVVTASVILPDDWFGNQAELENRNVFVKAGWEETQPQVATPVAIYAGAVNGIVEINGTLYLAREDGDKYIIQRPIESQSKESEIRGLLKKKAGQFFR